MENTIYNKVNMILKKLEIPNSSRFMLKMCAGTNGDIFRRSLYNMDMKNIQTGGAEKYKIINYYGVDFKFLIYGAEKGLTAYALHILDDINKMPECIVIMMHKEENTALITNISQQLECYTKEQRQTLIKSNIKVSGELLMKLAIRLVIKVKDEYNIKYIVLQDNSYKMCDMVNINLGLMYTLLNGITWYSKFGFVPANSKNNDISESGLKSVKKNQKIMDALTVKDVSEILIKLISKYDSKIRAEDMIKANEKIKLSEFLRKVLKMKKGCYILEAIYQELARKIGIVDFLGKMFILEFK